MKGIILYAPKAIEEAFINAGFKKEAKHPVDCVLFFAANKDALEKHIEPFLEKCLSTGSIWIAFPKVASSLKGDLTRDILWGLMKPFGYKPVSLIALDETWSGMRFKEE
ncbi:hypothetical protein HZB00_00945 [Candidatus Woesearchaeota archaeon]|nr:hypothetical protein [Candidatus Woesearchaeota archaeon]